MNGKYAYMFFQKLQGQTDVKAGIVGRLVGPCYQRISILSGHVLFHQAILRQNFTFNMHYAFLYAIKSYLFKVTTCFLHTVSIQI